MVGREIYQWVPDGLSAGRLAVAVDRALGRRTWTRRNWNTVVAIGKLIEGLPS